MAERRALAFWVSEEEVFRTFRVRWELLTVMILNFIEGVPADAVVSHVWHDPRSRGFRFVVTHPSFPVWHDGDICPDGGNLSADLVLVRRTPDTGDDMAPATLEAWEALVAENAHLRAVFGDLREDSPAVRSIHALATATERERCARLVETGGERYPDILDLAVQYGVNTALAALIRSGIPVKEETGEGE